MRTYFGLALDLLLPVRKQPVDPSTLAIPDFRSCFRDSSIACERVAHGRRAVLRGSEVPDRVLAQQGYVFPSQDARQMDATGMEA